MNKFVQIAVEEIGSQLALAKHCGVNQSAISLWLKGGGISGTVSSSRCVGWKWSFYL